MKASERPEAAEVVNLGFKNMRIKRPEVANLVYTIRLKGRDVEINSTIPAHGTGTIAADDLEDSALIELVEDYARFLANYSGCAVQFIDSAGQVFDYKPNEKFREWLSAWLITLQIHSDQQKLDAIKSMPVLFHDNGHLLVAKPGSKDVEFRIEGVAARPAIGAAKQIHEASEKINPPPG